jgi:mannose-6-phosphate isomerase-like protein (cupin superfamily)
LTVPVVEVELLVRDQKREASILVARADLTITYACLPAGEQVARPHVHHEHTDAFYVLEGELVFEVGRESQEITVNAGGFLAAPPLVAHSFRTAGAVPSRWLTIHAPDGGFAAFMRGMRDGVEVDWDIAPVPADGGRPAGDATVRPGYADLVSRPSASRT